MLAGLNIIITFLLIFQTDIFSQKVTHTSKSSLAVPGRDAVNDTVSVLFGGDVMLGRGVMQTTITKSDYSYPFEKIKDFTKESDIFFVNLENPIIDNCPENSDGLKFCASPGMIAGLRNAGINVVSVANNHSGNYGKSGITETKDFLERENIMVVGQSDLLIKEFGNFSIGFLGFDFTVKSPAESDYRLIKESDGKVDFLIIGVHWGEEYKSKANPYQRKWAREIVRDGADIIVGHHPHWIQDFECIGSDNNESIISSQCDGINGIPVYYSLGNLVFDQMWSEETKKGLLVKLELGKEGIKREEKYNTYMESIGQPEISSNF